MKSTFKAPDTIVLVFGILCFFSALTWVIPGGEYQRVEKNGRSVVDPSSFEYVSSEPTTLGDVLIAPIRGFTDPSAASIIGFILIVAGSFSIIEATGSIHALVKKCAFWFNTIPKLRPFFIPFFMTLFSFMGATFGMSEEVIVFIPLFVSLSLAIGYDKLVGVAVPFVGAGVGFAGAMYNPFTIGIAQGFAEIPIFSGTEFRFGLWVVFTITGILLIYSYARSIAPKTVLSTVLSSSNNPSLTLRQTLILILFLLGMVLLVVGVKVWGWYINELSGLFLALGILSALLGKLTSEKLVQGLKEGMQSVLGAVIVVALSKSVLLILEDAKAIDTILFYLSGSIQNFAPIVTANLMLAVQTCINVVVPSGSGQAALTIPIMAPLGDIVGVSRQTVVLIFQLGDGITNMIIPTSGVTMGVLGMAGVSWERWARWLFPKILVLYALSVLSISLAVVLQYA